MNLSPFLIVFIRLHASPTDEKYNTNDQKIHKIFNRILVINFYRDDYSLIVGRGKSFKIKASLKEKLLS